MSELEKKQAAKDKAVTKKAREVVAKKRQLPEEVLYVSSNPEVTSIPITVVGEEIRPHFCNERKYLMWSVPRRLTERFEMHEFFVQGRIIREDG